MLDSQCCSENYAVEKFQLGMADERVVLAAAEVAVN